MRIMTATMFLRATPRKKDGKAHHYWSIVEKTRVSSGRVVQRHVLYLGEINSSQEHAWRKCIEVFEEGAVRPRTLALFPENRYEDAVRWKRVRFNQFHCCKRLLVSRPVNYETCANR